MTSGFLRSVKSKMADCTGKTKVKTSATTAMDEDFSLKPLARVFVIGLGSFTETILRW